MATQFPVQETVDKLNRILPIHLTAADVHNNPEFVKLLFTLCRHIDEKGVGREVKKEYDEVFEDLQEKKRKYLQVHTLYSEIKTILTENEIDKQTKSTLDSTDQVYNALQTAISSAEAVDYLDFTPEGGDEVTLLGLKPEELLPSSAHLRNQQQSFQQHVIPELESRMKSKCEMIVSIHNPINENDSRGLSFAKAGQLPAILAKEKKTLESEKRLLEQDHMMIDQQFRQYYKALLQCLKALEQLISKHRLQAQMEYDKITTNWLAAKCDAMCLKIKVLQNQLIKDTYTPGAVTALRKIREHLVQAEQEETRQLQRAGQTLQAYESVGMGFDQLVQEYTVLLREIDNKRWALSELRQSHSPDQDDLWSHR
ncbi:hypothetical protein QZH41_010411 [Actinostola sp. cb2023]|nr:hypothetical protein QZH41_010411 [Actinostola sp. cb2023]